MKIFLVAVALAVCAAPAYADSPWTATPVQATSKSQLAAGSVIWDCDSTGCRTVSRTSGADKLSACRALAREAGKLTAFVAGAEGFDATRLASCNAAAKTKP